MNSWFTRVSGAVVLIVTVCLVIITGSALADGDRDTGPAEVAKIGFFYVGGREFSYEGRTNIVDQTYVEFF
ncbi:MAG: hypothetical protein ACRD4M_14030, partial [Candidatus Acidiferrales bacterium]